VSRRAWAGLVAGGATAFLLATDVVPAVRGPESWRWARRPLDGFEGLAIMLLLFAAMVAAARAMRHRFGRTRGGVRTAAVAAFVVLAFAQMIVATAIEPGGLSNLPRRVLDPSFTSYHTIARDVTDVREFLRTYPRRQPHFPVHGPSQPPGRVLFFHAINRWVDEPDRTAGLLDLGERLGGVPDGPPGTTDVQRAGAFAAGWILLALGALAIVPLFVIARGGIDPASAAATVLLFSCVPSYVLFTPETDHLLLLLSLTSAALLVEAMRYASRARAGGLAFGAGLFAGAGMVVSLTMLAALFAWALAFAGMIVLGARRRTPMPPPRRVLTAAALAILGFAIVPSGFAAAGLDWPAVVRECFAAARRVQVLVHGRDYATWVRWNLWDFALFLGPPLAIAAVARVREEVRALREPGTRDPAARAI
jgi:hypothetical protein